MMTKIREGPRAFVLMAKTLSLGTENFMEIADKRNYTVCVKNCFR
jgi:hypothetical protein